MTKLEPITLEEIQTLAMLLGESPPRVCNSCHGQGFIRTRPYFSVSKAEICVRCSGEKCDWIGKKTRQAMRERFWVDSLT